ncbi:transposase [Xanthomonas sacchari]|uniref:transposase n=1 Tax=Xanthomonas sacchari TaxID=56458 RepID=UPI001427A7C3
MDEFAIQKATATPRWCRCGAQAGAVGGPRTLPGRGQAVLRVARPERCARIEAVAMDMNAAYDLEVRQHCPNARVSTTCSTGSPSTVAR